MKIVAGNRSRRLPQVNANGYEAWLLYEPDKFGAAALVTRGQVLGQRRHYDQFLYAMGQVLMTAYGE